MPRFLIDNQLPRKLALHLRAKGWDVTHVRDRGLDEASDLVIADIAINEGLVVISKDEDFVLLSDLHGAPQVIWVRLGNCRNDDLLLAFDHCHGALMAAVSAGQRVALVS